MVVQRDKLVSEIRALSEEDKIRLLDVILNELDKPDPEIDQVWADEARKRWNGMLINRADSQQSRMKT